MKLMAIDGNSIVNRAFYGIRMLNAPDGTPTNAVYGFISVLQRLLDDEKPDGVCVAFDLKAPTFRHLQYEGYKAQRKAMPEELVVQMPLLKQTLDAMGVMRLEREGFEADDLLGTISRICEKHGDECVIVTGDKDSFQLISAATRVLNVKTRMGQTETINYTRDRFFEEYGFEPPKMVDLKALMGDASDNIPGVPGVGEKTALALIRSFGSLDNVYAGLDSPEIKDGVRRKLQEGADSAKMSFQLATIVTDAPISFEPSGAKWNYDFTPALYEQFKRLGFTKFIEKYKLRPPENSETTEMFEGKCESVILKTMGDVRAALDAIGSETVYVWCEDFPARSVFCAGDTAWVLFEDKFEDELAAAVGALFAPEISKAGHNIKDIQRGLMAMGVPCGGWVFDSALAAYLLDSTAGGYEIDRLAVKYCGFEPWHGEDSGGQTSMFGDDAAKIGAMASQAESVAALRPVLEQKLEEAGLKKLFDEIELPLCPVLADMENEGFFVDRAALAAFGDGMVDAIDALQKSIWEMAGEEFNINSPKQLGPVLFEKLMLPAGKKTKTGWSTNADILEKLRGKHPIIEAILDYRTLTKLKSTYADGLLKVIAPDGRIHTSFQMTVTATGRLSSTEPNLQNIPVRREFGAQIRKMFVAPRGKVLVDADYSQIELRLLAHISGDQNMIDAFKSGEDIHAVTASQVFGVPLKEVTSVLRSRAKAVNFGIVYGISSWSLAQDIGVLPAEAKAYMDAYLEKYHGVREYQKNIVEKARRDGCVRTLYGRRRELPELKSSNFNMRSFGERVALNMPIQGTAADIIKLAMLHVYERLKSEGLRSKLILQVHDELIAECPLDEAERVRAILTGEMERAAQLSVPLTADAGQGTSWAEAH